MQKVLTAEEMREVDRLTTERYGIPSIILMENAAHAVARVITERICSVKDKRILVLCGKGNNGGDGAALARILLNQDYDVTVVLFGKAKDTKNDAKVNFSTWEKYDYRFYEVCSKKEWDSWYWKQDFNFDVIVDSIFGTGLNRSLDIWLWNIVHHLNIINEHPRPQRLIVSIDLPSGLNADLATPIGENFQADLTVTFTAPKLANVFPPASNFNGELVVANIGSPYELIENSSSKLFITEKEDVQSWLSLTSVKPGSFKKTRGTALIIAGSENYSGAAVLSGNACFSAGAGMVTVAVPKQIHQIVAAKTLDEIIVKSLENIDVATEKVSLVALGCGMANDEFTHQFILQTVENRKTPMVLDAEALNALSPFNLQGSNELPLVLTPHIGEFRRLLGREVGEDKIAEVREFAQKHNVILVLKGERSLIAKPDGTVVINPTGNAGVSRAGAGDTLTGIITSLIAQTLELTLNEDYLEFDYPKLENIFNATVSAVYIAGLAGEIAADKYSERLMTATDVRKCLREAIEKINK